jgi:uncharacterized membrane protein
MEVNSRILNAIVGAAAIASVTTSAIAATSTSPTAPAAPAAPAAAASPTVHGTAPTGTAPIGTAPAAGLVETKAPEKCFGVVKAGKNDCKSTAGLHSCAAQSLIDGDKGDWILLPAGTCDRLVSGMLESKLNSKTDKKS